MTKAQAQTPAPVPDLGARVAQYVKLRDTIKEIEERHKGELSPYKEALVQLNSVLLQHLQAINADSASTEGGTVYRTKKTSASIQDAAAFWTFVVTSANFDLLDKRANVTAVADYVEKNKQLPPGVNLNSVHVVGVRRK